MSYNYGRTPAPQGGNTTPTDGRTPAPQSTPTTPAPRTPAPQTNCPPGTPGDACGGFPPQSNCGTPTEGTLYVVGVAGQNNNTYYLYQGGQLHQLDPGTYGYSAGSAVQIDASCPSVWGVGAPISGSGGYGSGSSGSPDSGSNPAIEAGTPGPIDGWINHFEQELQPLYKPALLVGAVALAWKAGVFKHLGRHHR